MELCGDPNREVEALDIKWRKFLLLILDGAL
jgi:hypothetical protein